MNEPGNGRATYTLIRDLPTADRPRERLRNLGADKLPTHELIAILLRTGSAKENVVNQAQRLLRDFGGLEGLRDAPFAELCTQPGIGEAKASQIKAALALGVRMASGVQKDKPLVSSPDDVAKLVTTEMSLFEQEVVRVILLDSRNRLIDMTDMYRGSVHTAQVRTAELLRPAVRANAPAIIVVHNHPSGDPTPSAPDVQLTKSLHEAAKLFDIDLHDHIVIGGGKHISMREYGLGFDDGR